MHKYGKKISISLLVYCKLLYGLSLNWKRNCCWRYKMWIYSAVFNHIVEEHQVVSFDLYFSFVSFDTIYWTEPHWYRFFMRGGGVRIFFGVVFLVQKQRLDDTYFFLTDILFSLQLHWTISTLLLSCYEIHLFV